MAVVRAVRRAVDADVVEELGSVRLLLASRSAELVSMTQECAQAVAVATLCGIELEAAEAEIERLTAEAAG